MEASVNKFVTVFHLPQVHSPATSTFLSREKRTHSLPRPATPHCIMALVPIPGYRHLNQVPGWMGQFGYGPLSVVLLDLNICGLKSSFEHTQHAMERQRSDNHSSY